MPDTRALTPGKPLFSAGEVGVVGSYASFFGFLLIATILSYRQIILMLIELLRNGLPDTDITLATVVMMLLFAVVFVVVPAYPVLRDIRSHLQAGNANLALMLVFLVIIYTIALVFQLFHVYQECAAQYPGAPI
ncbi:hypothetical protein FGU65_05105 [Methanoculleus sp. FWC-SCC1]|uniref:DUF1634 domain-containing protein n=1 Tax=Methanoculleus frigidifontis TaxID=2584085 RepID=A0ABT8M8N4_9EURY|nr:hypothetical protein [Methanoculleus sp. FWC-SCC1]MDN7024274.1 hypothetical protein [Methanoculleus sp. FWC-SCC1]